MPRGVYPRKAKPKAKRVISAEARRNMSLGQQKRHGKVPSVDGNNASTKLANHILQDATSSNNPYVRQAAEKLANTANELATLAASILEAADTKLRQAINSIK